MQVQVSNSVPDVKAPKTPQPYCYDNPAKKRLSGRMRTFYRQAAKELQEFSMSTHFNPGGIAVWGETYCYVFADGKPVVEAFNTNMGILVRQWDGKNSGYNNYVHNLVDFVRIVRGLAAKPFVRF